MAKLKKNKAEKKEPVRNYKASPDMEKLMVPIGDLSPDPNNARTHPERSIVALMESLDRFGYQKPVVATRDGVVHAGNGTVEAAQRLGWTHVPVSRTDLKGADLAAYAIADNRTNELSEWNEGKLFEQIEAAGQSLVGFDQDEVIRITKAVQPPEAPAEFPAVGEDIPTDHRCPKCGYEWSGKPGG